MCGKVFRALRVLLAIRLVLLAPSSNEWSQTRLALAGFLRQLSDQPQSVTSPDHQQAHCNQVKSRAKIKPVCSRVNLADATRGNAGRKFFVFFTSLVVNFNGRSMNEERKTLEQRAQMTDLERLRHSASHVLAFCHSERSRESSDWGSREIDGRAEG
jgi:hypothetical protein